MPDRGIPKRPAHSSIAGSGDLIAVADCLLAAAETRPSRGAANHPNDKPMAALTSAILRIVYLIQETFGSNGFCRCRLTDNV
jgi:hypothetical protein